MDRTGAKWIPSTAKYNRKQLEEMCCTLIRLGHADVWTYPWGIYLSALHEIEKTTGAKK